MVEQIQQELQAFIEPEKAEFLPKFFKTGAGEYAEGDVFLGVRVPWQRKVARKYFQHVGLEDIKALLSSPVHEYRSVALIILVHKYEKAKYEEEKEKIAQFYLDNLDHVNNWDLVDLSADKILGAYLFDKDRQPLLELAASQDLWRQRVAMIATFYFIRKGDFADTLALAELFLDHPHHLIHKAVGWMLREVGKRDQQVEIAFLKEHYKRMPRTMLRYAIEKLEPQLRQEFLKGLV
ncbi:MAG TPA: DNA alkylation repair protein [Firmicutes bacterium]|jgi:3-methyladenine DNA glycosylase AlkD|nr:MAG: DNA alkylation repair protein [Peptococcaceae bacterium 1109]HHT73288.1 DNA alkylation repair protein [Bacillota bacterium]